MDGGITSSRATIRVDVAAGSSIAYAAAVNAVGAHVIAIGQCAGA
jgi:hypothetical protein